MPQACCNRNAMNPALGEFGARCRGAVRLAMGTAVILVLWLVVLPWLADLPPVRRHIEFLEQRRIDPSAMFYTELDVMDEILPSARGK